MDAADGELVPSGAGYMGSLPLTTSVHMAGHELPPYPKRSPGGPAGVVFVLDSSGSIGEHDWRVTLQFARQITEGLRYKAKEKLSNVVTWIKRDDTKHNNLGEYMSDPTAPEAVHIGAVVYSSYATTHWGLNERKTTEQLALDIQDLRYEGGKTNTYEGLIHAEQIFMATSTVYSKHIVILITDGQSNNKNKTVGQAQKMHDNGVEIFVIGVGAVSQQEMDMVASKPLRAHCHYVPDHAALQATKEKIVKVTYNAVEKEIKKSAGWEMIKREFFQILLLLLVLLIVRFINSLFFEEERKCYETCVF